MLWDPTDFISSLLVCLFLHSAMGDTLWLASRAVIKSRDTVRDYQVDSRQGGVNYQAVLKQTLTLGDLFEHNPVGRVQLHIRPLIKWWGSPVDIESANSSYQCHFN